MLLLRHNGQERFLNPSLATYLRTKREFSRDVILNPPFEAKLKAIFDDVHQGGGELCCACSLLQPKLTIKKLKGKGYTLTHKPGENIYHRESCQFFQPNLDDHKVISANRLMQGISIATGLNVCFKPRKTDTPIFKAWNDVKGRIISALPFLSDHLFIARKERPQFLAQPFAVWIDVAASRKELTDTVFPYGSYYIDGPFFCVSIKLDDSILNAAIPIASYTLPLIVFNDIERQSAIKLADLMGYQHRIHSSFEGVVLGHRINTMRARLKGSKKQVHIITGADSESIQNYLQLKSADSEFLVIENQDAVSKLNESSLNL